MSEKWMNGTRIVNEWNRSNKKKNYPLSFKEIIKDTGAMRGSGELYFDFGYDERWKKGGWLQERMGCWCMCVLIWYMSRCYLCIKCREMIKWYDVELIYFHKNATYNAPTSYQSTTLDTICELSLFVSSQLSKKTAEDILKFRIKLCSLTLLLQPSTISGYLRPGKQSAY